jgi:cobalt/nickel transport system permease protein
VQPAVTSSAASSPTGRRRRFPAILPVVHIPDGFLNEAVVGATWVVAGAGVAVALHAEKSDPNPAPAGILGAAAAFVFAAQMINIPVAPGMSGHLVGGALAAVLLGPWRALIVMAVVLAVQALLFQDGGVSALGANTVDMGLGGVLAGYAVAALVSRIVRSPRGWVIGGVAGAFAATVVSASLTALWLGLSGLYPLKGILAIMLVSHTGIGVLEAALTGAILVTVVRWRPDLIRGISSDGPLANPTAVLGGVMGVALAIAAFLSPFASNLPDGLERAAERIGIADRAQATLAAPFPDYTLPFAASAGLATAAAGALGTLATALIGWMVSRGIRTSRRDSHQ